jgi:hypothetical protein
MKLKEKRLQQKEQGKKIKILKIRTEMKNKTFEKL